MNAWNRRAVNDRYHFTASVDMNLVEVAIFIGFPTCLAFCFSFPLRDGVRFALTAGASSAIAAAIMLFLFGTISRLLMKRWPAIPVFKAWSCIALSLTSLVGVLAIQQS